MDKARDHCVKQNKPKSEKLMQHVFCHLCNTDLKTNNVMNVKGGLFEGWKLQGEGKRSGWWGVNMVKLPYMHIWKQKSKCIRSTVISEMCALIGGLIFVK
jgi:hypothetical protein